jgi:hypothetical protein
LAPFAWILQKDACSSVGLALLESAVFSQGDEKNHGALAGITNRAVARMK